MSTRSLIETVGTLHLVHRRGSVESDQLRDAYHASKTLFAKLQTFRDSLNGSSPTGQEKEARYDAEPPF